MKKGETWNCDFCGGAGLTIAKDGIIYCRFCNKSYHQNMYDVAKKLLKEKKDG